MRVLKSLFSSVLLCVFFLSGTGRAVDHKQKVSFAIHGGAGSFMQIPDAVKTELNAKLSEAVSQGYAALLAGKSSVDAVELAIRILEDSPLFNAGKGAVFSADGRNELDASIMDGSSQAAGAVAGLRHVKNPISLARAVMEKSKYVMMIGDGAEEFAREMKIDLVDAKYFWTKDKWEEYLNAAKQKANNNPLHGPSWSQNKFGTVGAVALDRNGNLAAGTSTGGMANKKFGRVGDSPIIGAGTYAKNTTCAVSATGHGEYFIRLGVAHEISSLIEHKGMSVQDAADLVIKKKLSALGGTGGVIAMDKLGNVAVSFNTAMMFRAYINKDGKPVVTLGQ